MPPLPNQTSPTILKIYGRYEDRESHAKPREHLGASLIGKECSRELWYVFRWAGGEKFEGRMLRLFQTGHREEDRVIEDLRAAGVTVWDKGADGKQFRFTEYGGHFACSLDGVAEKLLESPKTAHVLEVKTSNDKSFKEMEKKGVEKAKPVHFAQMQIGMGFAELKRAVYIMVNKNTDHIYLERIKYSPAVFKRLIAKAVQIITSSEPLTRISDDPARFVCRFCSYQDQCHGDEIPAVNCRTCVHSTPKDDGTWQCKIKGALDVKTQVEGCDEHLMIPSMLAWAKPVDAGDGWVEYATENGVSFVNVAAGGFPAKEITGFASKDLGKVSR